MKLDKTSGPIAAFGAKLDLTQLIAKHTDEGDDFHFDLHTIRCIGSQWSGGVTFTELSTLHILFNLRRAIQSGWELQIQADSSFVFCAADLSVIMFGVN